MIYRCFLYVFKARYTLPVNTAHQPGS